MKKVIAGLFMITCVAQWSAPVSMIFKRERTLREGDVFLFRTAPVDPYDAFRGRYVYLNFDINTVTNLVGFTNMPVRASMLARLENDEDGFARIISLDERLDDTVPAIPVEVLSVYEGTVRLALPLDRFYMEETLAPKAERLYMRHSRNDSSNTYAVVRVYKHFPVIEDLIIDGRPVGEYARDEQVSPP